MEESVQIIGATVYAQVPGKRQHTQSVGIHWNCSNARDTAERLGQLARDGIKMDIVLTRSNSQSKVVRRKDHGKKAKVQPRVQ